MREWGMKTKMKGSGLGNLPQNTRRGIAMGFATLGEIVKKEFKKQVMATPKHGRLYRLKGGNHIASAPFETPANRSGHYRDSYGYRLDNLTTLVIGNYAKYANYLEHGTGVSDKKNKILGRGQEGKRLQRLLDKNKDNFAIGMQPRQGLLNSIEAIGETKVRNLLEQSIRMKIK